MAVVAEDAEEGSDCNEDEVPYGVEAIQDEDNRAVADNSGPLVPLGMHDAANHVEETLRSVLAVGVLRPRLACFRHVASPVASADNRIRLRPGVGNREAPLNRLEGGEACWISFPPSLLRRH